VGAHHPVAEGHVVAEPAGEVIDQFAGRLPVTALELGQGLIHMPTGGIVLGFMPHGVGRRRGFHEPFLVREVLFDTHH